MTFLRRLLLTGLAACALAGTVAGKPVPPAPKPPVPSGPLYFFNVTIDPRYQIVGQGPLDPALAPAADCYCFTYDAGGKLQRIEFDRAGTPMPDPFFNVARIDFEYAPGLERRWYRDGTGQSVTNLDGVQGEELKLNAAGFPTTVTNLNDSGGTMRDSDGVVRIERTLDKDSRVTQGRRTGLLGIYIRDGDGNFDTRTRYDNQGRKIAYANFDSAGQPLNNDEGIATKRFAYAQAPEGTQVTETYFDAAGQPAEEKSTGIHARQSQYDPRGFLASVAYFDAAGAPTADLVTGIHARRLTYDAQGNQTSEEFFGTDNQPRNHRVFGYARINYRYDAKNRVSEKSYVGDDGLPQIIPNVGAAVIRQEYDDQGNIVRRQFFDGQGAPANHVQYGVPAIRIRVEGDTTMVSLRDAKDEVTPATPSTATPPLATRRRPTGR